MYTIVSKPIDKNIKYSKCPPYKLFKTLEEAQDYKAALERPFGAVYFSGPLYCGITTKFEYKIIKENL